MGLPLFSGSLPYACFHPITVNIQNYLGVMISRCNFD
jgi:hypothetical protein